MYDIHCITQDGRGTIVSVGIKNHSKRYTKQEIIDAIGNGDIFYTIVGNRRGQPVYAVPERNPQYLTTKPNHTTRDNLGELPTCR